MIELIDYLPLQQTPDEELAFKRILERVEAIKNEMGSRYILAKENCVKRLGEKND